MTWLNSLGLFAKIFFLSPSWDIPKDRHFWKRQYWHLLRFFFWILQERSQRSYSSFIRTVRRKKPWVRNNETGSTTHIGHDIWMSYSYSAVIDTLYSLPCTPHRHAHHSGSQRPCPHRPYTPRWSQPPCCLLGQDAAVLKVRVTMFVTGLQKKKKRILRLINYQVSHEKLK